MEGAVILAERIRTAVEKYTFMYNSQKIQVTVSIGFAVTEPDLPATYDQMKHVAAAALADAKETGRNRSVIRQVIPKAGAAADGAAAE